MALPEEPYTRVERYLARLAGQNVDIPDYPITRIECYLDYLCGNGGGVPAPNAGAHNAIFRGKDLGSAFTDAQSAAIRAGTFDDIYVGDYWTINSTVYRVAGLDLYRRYGDTELTTHHAVIVPDQDMYKGSMNTENVTTGGYAGSAMKTTGLNQALATIKADFGETHIVRRRTELSTAITGGAPSLFNWFWSEIDLMSEGQVLGRGGFGTQAQSGFNVGERYGRFPLFALMPEFVPTRAWYWLQDIKDGTRFCYVTSGGGADSYSPSASGGVRPYFLIA